MMILDDKDRQIIKDIQNGADRIEMAWKYKVTVPHINRLLRHIGIKPTGMEIRRAHLELFMKEYNALNGTDYKAKI